MAGMGKIKESVAGRQEALAAAARNTPYGEVLLATRDELASIRAELEDIRAAVERLGAGS